MRKFNVTGLCVIKKHYMADTSNKLAEIRKMIDNGEYFTINRARQYGKTTTLSLLRRTLPSEYMVISISFEGVGVTMFANAQSFCQRFLWQLDMTAQNKDSNEKLEWQNERITDFDELSVHLTKMCAGRKIVLMIDEVDKASNYEMFLHFLGMLRNKYLQREDDIGHTFHSVILAGVHDIKNWNIAASFDVDMSFNPTEISTMLAEYEADHNTGMDVSAVSEEIYSYTSGYPFLVSRICQCIDEELNKDWGKSGIQEAVKVILHENNVLFDDLAKNLENYKGLYEFLYSLLIVGERKSFMLYDPDVMLASMFGYIKSDNGSRKVVISNKIFEILMSDYFASKDSNASRIEMGITGVLYQDVVKDNVFDMELCLRKFAEHYKELFTEDDRSFLEKHGRLLFLSYLKPLINGHGFYHIESQFTDSRRMDVVVDFGHEQFIIELKLWRGESEHQKAYEQLAGYLDNKNAITGYLLTFDFRKGANKQPHAEWIDFHGKRIFDVVV